LIIIQADDAGHVFICRGLHLTRRKLGYDYRNA